MQEGLTESDAVKYLNDINYKACVGKVCKSKLSGDFKILKYNGARDIEIQFLKTRRWSSSIHTNARSH